MEGEKKRCENCWVMVGEDLDVCPNCSHPFPLEVPVAVKNPGSDTVSKNDRLVVSVISRPFKFILIFLLSFIAILAFIIAEGGKLNGSGNTSYLFGDVIWVSLVALMLTAAFMFIDYMISD
jgi:hypothetical protein